MSRALTWGSQCSISWAERLWPGLICANGPPGASPASATCSYPQVGREPVHLRRLSLPPLPPNYQPAAVLTSLLARSAQRGDSGAAALQRPLVCSCELGFLAEQLQDVSACHCQPVGNSTWSLQENQPPRCILYLWQRTLTALKGDGLNRPQLDTGELMINPWVSRSERTTGCLCNQGVTTLPITAALTLSEEIKWGRIYRFPG